jgi:peptidoglycan/LPS O-acetylase OafA/YrhL
MSVTTAPTVPTTNTTFTVPSAATRPATRRTSLRRTTVVAGLGAAAGTTAAAAAIHAAGVSLAVGGEMIPLAGFAQMTFLGAVIGGLLLAVLNRRSDAPHGRFIQTAVVLTALSCVPSVALPSEAATKVALVFLHLLAAAIIIPALARRAND